MADQQDDDFVEDMGEPIDALRDLSVDPSDGFLGRLRNTLRRRDLSSQVATLSWTGFGAVALEFFRMIFSMLEPPVDGEGED